MLARILACLAAVGLSASLAWAHDQERGRPNKWWQSSSFRAELALTPQQSDEIETIFQTTLPKLRAQKEELDKLEGVLSKMIAEGTVDESKVVQKLDRVEHARAELAKTRTLMLFRMYRVLTADQRQKLKILFERLDRDRERDRKRPWN